MITAEVESLTVKTSPAEVALEVVGATVVVVVELDTSVLLSW